MAENRNIYTALNVSTIPLQPSVDCVQWSGDGQIIVANKYAIYILVLAQAPYFWFVADEPEMQRLRNVRLQISGSPLIPYHR
jgi:hypothetical protein